MKPALLTFWISSALVAYTYVGYPLVVWVLARLVPNPVRKGPVTPTITVVIAARNEEARIGAKVEACLALDYPPESLDVIVVSDGSTDRTAATVADYASRFPGRVELVALPERLGKAGALNAGAARASGEILLLADVRQRLDGGVARALARNFHDPEVGAVSGELILLGAGEDAKATGLGAYWRYEKWVRQAESRWGSSMGYTGSVSAIRRSLFKSLSPETLVDDLVMALRVIAAGHRVVFEPEAKAYDTVSAVPGREFARKVRTQAGTLQTGLEAKRLVGPLGFGTWWQFASHKLLRLIVPYLLVAIWVASALLEEPVYPWAWLAQSTLYVVAGLGLLAPSWARRITGASLPSTFVMLNWAAVVGAWSYLAGRRLELWQSPSANHTAAS
jgi:cellulose synthase/poly-beta-1,6-N-acetylglucosamine synthase-like glycosyltransferase